VNKETVGSLDKVSIFVAVKISDYKIPVVYSDSLDSLNLLSSLRVIEDREVPSEEFLSFSRDPEIGLREIQEKYLKKPITEKRQIHETVIREYREQYGKVRGKVQDLRYRVYDIGLKWNPEDFKEGVVFIPFEELGEKMDYQFHSRPDIKSMNEIYMMVEGKQFRIDSGVTFTFKKFVDELRAEQLSSLIAEQKELDKMMKH
jgi:hypothetical protein